MKYIVGKPKIKSALGEVIGTMIFAFILVIFDRWDGMDVVAIVLIVISIFILLPGISYCELMWRVDENVLQYTLHETFLMKIKAFYKHIFKDHRLEYQMTINLNQIDYIAVTYAKLPRAPYGAYGYDVLFEVHMYDGSVFTFQSLTLSGRKDFNQAVDYMKQKGIRFKDRYGILEALKGDTHLSYYLEKIDKENQL